jgi:Family of unknown function (DUF6932)
LLPSSDKLGYLPPGIHSCEVDGLIARFGSGSAEREVETQELIEFVAWARLAGIVRLVVNGSYVTAKVSPNDVDVVGLPGPDYPRDESPISQQESRWPFLQVFIAVDDADLEEWSLKDFGTDRRRRVKGVVEVKL